MTIAINYRKFPEALRFQKEMFSNGYKNSPRIMRLMGVIMNQRPAVPDWWTAAKAKARAIAKQVKNAIKDLFESSVSSKKKSNKKSQQRKQESLEFYPRLNEAITHFRNAGVFLH